jgi:predicted nucleic acid-binding protein
MAINPPHKLRVMVDANVLIAGTGWPRFPYEVLQHATAGDFQLVLSPFIIDEAYRHITRLFPELSSQFEQILSASEYEAVASPAKEELAQYPDLVRDKNDIPVALAAINAHVD